MKLKPQNKKILIIEDEFITASALNLLLGGMGFEIVGVEDTGEGAIKATEQLKPDIVLMDIVLNGEMNGITAATHIREQFNIPVIYLTGQADDSTIFQAIESEPFGYIIKPFEEKNLKTSIMMALYKHELDQKLMESERRYRAIAELAQDSIIIFDRDYSIAYLNSYAIQFFKKERIGKSKIELSDIFPQELVDQVQRSLDSILSEGRYQRITLQGKLDSDEFWLDTIFVPILSRTNDITQIIALSRDITIQVLFDKEMEKQGIIQIEKNMEQFQILNDEIRNPLAVIMSIISLHDDEESRIVLEQIDHINNLVSRLDHGWVESEKVRSFFIKHYGYGKLCQKDEHNM